MRSEAGAVGSTEKSDSLAEDLVRDRYPEGLVRHLEQKYPTARSWAEEAVAHAVEQLVVTARGPRGVTSPKAFLTAVATNFVLDVLTSPEIPDDEVGLGRRVRSAEDEALVDELYQTLKSAVERWETVNLRVVTLLFLEAAYEAVPLTFEEAAVMATAIMGESISVSTVWRLKERGFARLVQVCEAFGVAGEDPPDEA